MTENVIGFMNTYIPGIVATGSALGIMLTGISALCGYMISKLQGIFSL